MRYSKLEMRRRRHFSVHCIALSASRGGDSDDQSHSAVRCSSSDGSCTRACEGHSGGGSYGKGGVSDTLYNMIK